MKYPGHVARVRLNEAELYLLLRWKNDSNPEDIKLRRKLERNYFNREALHISELKKLSTKRFI